MTDDSYLFDSKDKKSKLATRWFGRLLKIFFVLCAFCLVILTVLHNMGGSNDMLKGGVTQTISNTFGGRPVKLSNLVHMGFFPTVALDIEGVGIYEKEKDIVPLITLQALQLYMPFWNVATKTPRVTKFYIEGFETIRGVFFPEAIKIDKIFIDHDVEHNVAQLKGSGMVGIHVWNFTLDLDIAGKAGKYSYMVAPQTKMIFDIADVHFESSIIRGEGNYLKFENFIFAMDNKKISGDLTVSAISERLLKIKGVVKAQDDRNILFPDLVVDFEQRGKMAFSGAVSSEKMAVADWIGDESVFAIFTRLRQIVGQGAIPRQKDGTLALLGANNLNIDFDLQNVDVDGQVRDKLSLKVVQDDGRIKIGPVKDQSEMVMPVIMAVYDQDQNALISILQDGRMDVSFLKLWLDNLSGSILKKDAIDVECGIMVFSEKRDHVEIGSFGIQTPDKTIGVKEKKIPYKTDFSDLNFTEDNKRDALLTVSLSQESYNFVQGSLQKSKEGSPCSSYVLRAAEPEQPPQMQTPQQSDQQSIQ